MTGLALILYYQDNISKIRNCFIFSVFNCKSNNFNKFKLENCSQFAVMSNASVKKLPHHLLGQIDVGLSQDASKAFYEFIGSEEQAKMVASHLSDSNLAEQSDQGLESETQSGDAEIASLKKELFASKLEVNRLLAENAKLKKEKIILQNATGEEKKKKFSVIYQFNINRNNS